MSAMGCCNMCGWQSGPQPSRDIAGYLSTWHVYEQHPEVWRVIAGDRMPADPDPRDPIVRKYLEKTT